MGDLLGHVARLQIQRTSLKYDRQYDPVPLLSVPEVVITARGVVGAVDRGWMLDAHHADHPFPRGRGRGPCRSGSPRTTGRSTAGSARSRWASAART